MYECFSDLLLNNYAIKIRLLHDHRTEIGHGLSYFIKSIQFVVFLIIRQTGLAKRTIFS